ncbi:MAG: glutathione S-transferase [Pyrobaculum sp.]
MNYDEFLAWATGQTPIFSQQVPHVLTFGKEGLYYVRDLELLMAFSQDGEVLRLGFLDLRRRVLVEWGDCQTLEEESQLWAEAEDVPWPGLSTKFAMAVYPIHCEGGRAYGFITVKFNVGVDSLYFNWGKIAAMFLRDRSEEFLQELNKKSRLWTRFWWSSYQVSVTLASAANS